MQWSDRRVCRGCDDVVAQVLGFQLWTSGARVRIRGREQYRGVRDVAMSLKEMDWYGNR